MVDEESLAELVRHGRYEDAAQICVDGGQPARAAELLATVWKYDLAIELTSEAGLFDEAYRHAIQAGARHATATLLPDLFARPDQAARAAGYAEAAGRNGEAARLREAAADLTRAAELYEAGGDLLDAARCWTEQGELRRAGLLLERRLKEDPDDTDAALRLAQILIGFGRWEHAIRALQIAIANPEHEIACGRLLVLAFHVLGMGDAAQSRLDALRVRQPQLPAEVPEMIEATFGAERDRHGLNERLLAGRYRVLRPLGAGGTGKVLLAEDAFFGREVAIKLLHSTGGSTGRDALVRFAREAKVAAALEHPNVVRVFDYYPQGPFLVMEHMPGGTLEDKLRIGGENGRAALSPLTVEAIARAILRALEAVHRRSVVHRDLKPENIFFGHAGGVKIGDFGVAHLIDLGATMTGAMVGTLAFMSPEQITGASKPRASMDLYALGIILYRCLTGVLPFPGPDFVAQHLDMKPELASHHAPWLTPAVDAFLDRLLQKDPSERPRSATEVLEQLQSIPFRQLEQDYLASRVEAPAPRHTSIPPAPSSDRYRIVETTAERTLARDELLERDVWIVRCAGQQLGHLRAWAATDSPFLQCIWAIDPRLGHAILEAPNGSRLDGSLDARARHELSVALTEVHERGLVHGSVDRDHIRVSNGRAVLMLPLSPAAAGMTIENDNDELSRL